jgi:DnaJ-class molecular chaperone
MRVTFAFISILWSFIGMVTLCGSSEFFGGGNPFQGAFYGGSRGPSRSTDNSLYDILGVDRDCSTTEVKKAYRREARTHHPDKGGDAETFKKLSEAYEVLSDEEKRANYDRYGLEGDRGSGGGNFRSASEFAQELFRGFGSSGGFPGAAFGNPFAMPLVFQLDISLEDLYKGRELVIPIQNMRVSVDIQPGMSSGQELMLKGQFYDERGQPRDLVFRLREVRHARFRRENADLLTELSISLQEALFGFERAIELLDGTTLVIKSREGEVLKHDDCLVVEEHGMPVWRVQGERGRLFVLVKIAMPRDLSAIRGSGNKEELQRLLSLLEGSHAADGPGLARSGLARTGWSAAGGKKGEKGARGQPTVELQRSDLAYFGNYGSTFQDDDDKYGGNPFAHFFR